MQRTNEDLVQAASRGDLASFGLLYERYYRLAVAVARARLSDVHLAEDAAQEAFAIAFRTIATLRNGSQFPQWLTTICRRTASRLDANNPAHEALTQEPDNFRKSDLQLLKEQVHDALQTLDESSREIVVLHYFGKLTYEEISEAMGLTIASIHGRLQRSRAKLAIVLDTQVTHKE